MGLPSPKNSTPQVAQIGSIVGAIFAALVGADPFDIRNRAHFMRWLDYVAIALWILAVVLFVGAAAWSASTALNAAVLMVAAAGALTVTSLVLVPLGWSVDHDKVLIRPSKAEADAIVRLCHKDAKKRVRLYGRVPTSTLDDDFVTFDFGDGTNSQCGTIRIPRETVIALVEHPPTTVLARGWLVRP